MQIEDLERKKFRKRLLGLDPGDVDSFLQDMNEVLRGLVEENENLKRTVQTQESELKEHREREKTIRAVLISAQKNAEQTRANAEREAKLVVSRGRSQSRRAPE